MICIKIRFSFSRYFSDGMFKIRWTTEFLLLRSTKERFCKKIKKLIFYHRVIIERATQTSLPTHPDLTETRGVGQVNSSSSSTTPKRKFLFANIDNDIKFCKKSKITD